MSLDLPPLTSDIGHSPMHPVNEVSIILKHTALEKIKNINIETVNLIKGEINKININSTKNEGLSFMLFPNWQKKRAFATINTQSEKLTNCLLFESTVEPLINVSNEIFKEITTLENILGSDFTVLKDEVTLLKENIELENALEKTKNSNITQVRKLSRQIIGKCKHTDGMQIKKIDGLLDLKCASIVSNLEDRLITISSKYDDFMDDPAYQTLRKNPNYRAYQVISKIAQTTISNLQQIPFFSPTSYTAPPPASSELLSTCNRVNTELDRLEEMYEHLYSLDTGILIFESIKTRTNELAQKIDKDSVLSSGCKKFLKADLKPILIKISHWEKELNRNNKLLTKEQIERFTTDLETLQAMLETQNNEYKNFCRLSREIPVAQTFLSSKVGSLFDQQSLFAKNCNELESYIAESSSEADVKFIQAQKDKLMARAEEFKKKKLKATKAAEFDQIRTSYIMLIRDAEKAVAEIERPIAENIAAASIAFNPIFNNFETLFQAIKNNRELPEVRANFLMKNLEPMNDERIHIHRLIKSLEKSEKIPTKAEVDQLTARVNKLKVNLEEQYKNYIAMVRLSRRISSDAAEDSSTFIQSIQEYNQKLHAIYYKQMKNGLTALDNLQAIETLYNQKKDLILEDQQAEKAKLEEEFNAAEFSIEALEEYIIGIAHLIEEQDHPNLEIFFE